MPITLDSLNEISVKIRNARKSLALSQKALAKLAGLSQSTVARTESDIESLNPSYSTIYQIVDALNSHAAGDGHKGELLGKKAQELMHKKVVFVGPEDTAEKAMDLMKRHEFSQLPVLTRNRSVVGTVTQKKLLEVATLSPDRMGQMKVMDVVEPALPQVDKNTQLSKIKSMLENWDAVLVVEGSRAVGIITIYDVFKIL